MTSAMLPPCLGPTPILAEAAGRAHARIRSALTYRRISCGTDGGRRRLRAPSSAMQAKRSYSGVLAAAAATAFSLQASVATAESSAVSDSDQPSDEAAIMARVRNALAADPQLLARRIEVSVRRGVVRLVAKSTPGVSKVDNEIELKTAPQPRSH